MCRAIYKKITNATKKLVGCERSHMSSTTEMVHPVSMLSVSSQWQHGDAGQHRLTESELYRRRIKGC